VGTGGSFVREWKIKERRQIFFKKIRREEQEEAVALTPSELWNIPYY
jgi:hypothetical protein